MALTFARATDDTLPLHVVDKPGLEAALDGLDPAARAWVDAAGFKARLGDVVVLPGPDGKPVGGALVGYGDAEARGRQRFGLAAARAKLPEGTWRLEADLTGEALDEVALGWLLAGYRFNQYRDQSVPKAELVAPPDGVDASRIEAIAAGEALTRDLINTPASDMGPAQLDQAARDLATVFGAEIHVTTGGALLDDNFPMVHAVGGRAGPQAPPRLIDMRWGGNAGGPRLTLVGKGGVCFDTGGLNLKPGGSMGG